MTDGEKKARLMIIKQAMAEIQRQAELISGHILALEAAGINLPAMRETAETLAQVALGWASTEKTATA